MKSQVCWIFQPVKGVHIASGADNSYEPEVGHQTNDRKHGKKDALGADISLLFRKGSYDIPVTILKWLN